MSDFIQDLWIYQHRELLENHLFWVVLFSLCLIGLVTRNPKEGWLQPFPAERPLIAMIRETIAACFSRWWIVGLPLIMTLIGSFEKNLLLWLSSHYQPALAQAWQWNCYAALEASLNIILRNRLTGVAEETLQSAYDFLKLRQSVILTAILIVPILVWIHKTKQREHPLPAKADSLLVWLYSLAWVLLLIAPIFLTGFTLKLMNNEESFDFLPWNALIIGIPYYGFGQPAWLSIWFAAIILIVADWDEDPDKKWFGGYFYTPPLLFNLTFRVFPAFILLGMINLLQSSIDNFSGNVLGSLTRAITIVVSWSFIPLPFLIARHNLNLETSFRWLGKTWRQHFFKLASLVLIIIAASAIGGIFDAFYSMLRKETSILEECARPLWQPNLILFAFEMVRTLLNLWSFLVVAIAFQSGALDLPSENKTNL